MSLQRRLLLYLMLCAPLVWAVALIYSVDRARHEVNELFDTEIIRLARQVQATLGSISVGTIAPELPPSVSKGEAAQGESDLRDLALAVWNAQGELLVFDREGVQLPYQPDRSGFVDLVLEGQAWRVYYLQSVQGEWLVATGQLTHEREELVWNLLSSQLVPWLLVLPVLLVAMAWAVRRALAPLRTLTLEVQHRRADALQPLAFDHTPSELGPLLTAMNGLFARIESTLARERRFTADAAHELRTPLAVLRAQWDVVRSAPDASSRRKAEERLSAGLERMHRLVTQLLALSRLEATDRLAHSAPIDWTSLVQAATNDVYALMERRRIELECLWPAQGTPIFPLQGDADLLGALLRNVLDNAARYAPEGSTVTLRFSAEGLTVENEGPPLTPAALAQLGERFHRPAGHTEGGSGLGISIAQRIATLHGLTLRYRIHPRDTGLIAELTAMPPACSSKADGSTSLGFG